MSQSLSETSTLLASISSLSPSDRQKLLKDALAEALARNKQADQAASSIWSPFPGPQTRALKSEADILLFGGAAGGGKGIDIHQNLPTPTGFVRMGDVKVGDVLFDDMGSRSRVTATSGITVRRCFKIEFENGASIIADDVHRWVTYDAKERRQHKTGSIRSTEELYATTFGSLSVLLQAFGDVADHCYIEKVSEVGAQPTQCIAVDSPRKTYLVGADLIPTHNTDLLLGAALTRHRSSIIFRREFKQLEGLRERAEQIYRPYGSFNGQRELWRLLIDGVHKRIEFGACQHAGDEESYQGRPHDLKAFDEITHFTLDQFRYLMGWNRSSAPGQRSRVIAAGNPPRSAEGYWVINYWAPWLDPKHRYPAKPGELRWFAQMPGKNRKMEDVEVENSSPIKIAAERDPIIPQSRTFIRAFVQDNPVYMESGYIRVLQALPEPLRSQMLHGDFGLGHEDDPKQVCPTQWVLHAQARWSEDRDPRLRMDALGCDIARGGRDKTVFTPRYGTWFGEPEDYPGSETPDGWEALQRIRIAIPAGESPRVNIDVVGIGAAVYDLAKSQGLHAVPMDARRTSFSRDSSGTWGFANKKAEWWWSFREALDPLTGDDLALPPDRELLADLTAVRWSVKSRGISVEDKDELIKRIGRSPDKGDSCVLAYATESNPVETRII